MKNIILVLAIIFIIQSCAKEEAPAPTTSQTITPVLEIGEFSLELPENNKDCEIGQVLGDKSDVEFKWKAAKNATKYELKITDILTGNSTSFTDISTLSKIVSLTRNKSYSWTITASNSSNKNLTSALWKFYLAGEGKTNNAPSPAIAIYPIPGSTVRLNTSGAIKFEWSSQDPDKDILTYSIRIDTLNNQKFNGSTFDSKISNFEIKLAPGKIYYWSVVSKDASIATQSDTFSFMLK